MDRKITDPESTPIDEPEYFFAYRETPREGQEYTGWQLVGLVKEIQEDAQQYAQEHSGISPQNQVRRYLKSQGYDPETIGRIHFGLQGQFAGFLETV